MAYATKADLVRRIAAARLSNIADDVIDETLDEVSDEFDTYARAQVVLPLVAPYPKSLVRHVCAVTIWRLICFKGVKPEPGTDDALERACDRALEWFKAIAKGQASFALTADSAPVPRPGGPRVSTEPSRGWRR